MTETGSGAGVAPKRSRLRRVLRLNALVLIVGILLVAGGAEIYFRVTTPFRVEIRPVRFVPGVGLIRPPHVEMRATNGVDFRTVSRTNTLGFLDREPPDPERAAASCHVTLIGDSFVEARQVPIAQKAQVLLEELAAREPRDAGVTASAFGMGGTGQVNQLAFYDRYARPLSPDLVVLVFSSTDMVDNSLPLSSLRRGSDPDYPPYRSIRRTRTGWEYAAPHPDSLANRFPRDVDRERGRGWSARIERRLREHSYFADWLFARYRLLRPPERDAQLAAWAERINRDPRYATLLEGWEPSTIQGLYDVFREERLPPFFEDALGDTGIALGQFRERAERDGAALIILATHELGEGDHGWERLRQLAEAERIPLISQADYIRAGGGRIEDAHWANDAHWNAAGHRWAAEAILAWLKRHPRVCGD